MLQKRNEAIKDKMQMLEQEDDFMHELHRRKTLKMQSLNRRNSIIQQQELQKIIEQAKLEEERKKQEQEAKQKHELEQIKKSQFDLDQQQLQQRLQQDNQENKSNTISQSNAMTQSVEIQAAASEEHSTQKITIDKIRPKNVPIELDKNAQQPIVEPPVQPYAQYKVPQNYNENQTQIKTQSSPQTVDQQKQYEQTQTNQDDIRIPLSTAQIEQNKQQGITSTHTYQNQTVQSVPKDINETSNLPKSIPIPNNQAQLTIELQGKQKNDAQAIQMQSTETKKQMQAPINVQKNQREQQTIKQKIPKGNEQIVNPTQIENQQKIPEQNDQLNQQSITQVNLDTIQTNNTISPNNLEILQNEIVLMPPENKSFKNIIHSQPDEQNKGSTIPSNTKHMVDKTQHAQLTTEANDEHPNDQQKYQRPFKQNTGQIQAQINVQKNQREQSIQLNQTQFVKNPPNSNNISLNDTTQTQSQITPPNQHQRSQIQKNISLQNQTNDKQQILKQQNQEQIQKQQVQEQLQKQQAQGQIQKQEVQGQIQKQQNQEQIQKQQVQEQIQKQQVQGQSQKQQVQRQIQKQEVQEQIQKQQAQGQLQEPTNFQRNQIQKVFRQKDDQNDQKLLNSSSIPTQSRNKVQQSPQSFTNQDTKPQTQLQDNKRVIQANNTKQVQRPVESITGQISAPINTLSSEPVYAKQHNNSKLTQPQVNESIQPKHDNSIVGQPQIATSNHDYISSPHTLNQNRKNQINEKHQIKSTGASIIAKSQHTANVQTNDRQQIKQAGAQIVGQIQPPVSVSINERSQNIKQQQAQNVKKQYANTQSSIEKSPVQLSNQSNIIQHQSHNKQQQSQINDRPIIQKTGAQIARQNQEPTNDQRIDLQPNQKLATHESIEQRVSQYPQHVLQPTQVEKPSLVHSNQDNTSKPQNFEKQKYRNTSARIERNNVNTKQQQVQLNQVASQISTQKAEAKTKQIQRPYQSKRQYNSAKQELDQQKSNAFTQEQIQTTINALRDQNLDAQHQTISKNTAATQTGVQTDLPSHQSTEAKQFSRNNDEKSKQLGLQPNLNQAPRYLSSNQRVSSNKRNLQQDDKDALPQIKGPLSEDRRNKQKQTKKLISSNVYLDTRIPDIIKRFNYPPPPDEKTAKKNEQLINIYAEDRIRTLYKRDNSDPSLKRSISPQNTKQTLGRDKSTSRILEVNFSRNRSNKKQPKYYRSPATLSPKKQAKLKRPTDLNKSFESDPSNLLSPSSIVEIQSVNPNEAGNEDKISDPRQEVGIYKRFVKGTKQSKLEEEKKEQKLANQANSVVKDRRSPYEISSNNAILKNVYQVSIQETKGKYKVV